MNEAETCVICDQSLSNGFPTVKLQQKGSDGINRASKVRGSNVTTQVGQLVHIECRKLFTCQRRLYYDQKREKVQEPPSLCTLRSETPQFKFKEHCLFCGEVAKWENNKRGNDVFPVRTSDFQCNISRTCEERNDDWGKLVASRLALVIDLHAADAVYHQQCSVNFRTLKNVPKQHSSYSTAKRVNTGRPEDLDRSRAFQQTVAFLRENDEEHLTTSDLIEKMRGCLEVSGCQAYSQTYMKQKLKEEFGDEIIITQLNGKPDVVTFRGNVSAIMFNFYKEEKMQDSKSEAMRIIRTAAKLIRSDIKSMDASCESYPSKEQMADSEAALNYLPETLQVFLEVLFTGKNTEMKRASIGQAIIQGTRPRVILAPLQFGLASEMHHKFSSRFIVDTLYKHGFGCSYTEIQRFERSAALQGGELPDHRPGQFIQFVADNVDHNIRTLDGCNTFHGMGMIASFTPGKFVSKPIPRITVSSDDIQTVGKINIKNFHSHTGDLPLSFKELTVTKNTDLTADIDLLWDISLLLHPRRPAWSGMMQSVHRGVHPGKSSILFLPMIDLDPSNMSCIFSTLNYLCDQAGKYNVTPVITFDQPLFWKAMVIIESQPTWSNLKKVVLRLGGLHVEMSFLGCVGHLMAATGLTQVLEVVYAENAVKHILSGKAIARAIRGHLMVYAALSTMLTANAYNMTLPNKGECHDLHQSLVNAREQYDDIIDNAGATSILSPEDVLREILDKLKDVLGEITDKLNAEKKSIKERRTAKLWLQYIEMIGILRMFIKAERIGDWKLHLQAVQEMLPYFAAAGHNLYAKSAYIYLQKMQQLPESHPEIYACFLKGYHVIRRSDRYWAGLSTDLVIEQVLMRSIKTVGGLTRGRGMTEIQRLVWLLSMPACADVSHSMQEFTGVSCNTSEQHKDSTQSRIKRDTEDTYKILNTLCDLDPFGPDPSLRGLVSGLVAHESVNVDDAKEVGQLILKSMIGKSVTSISFVRKKEAVTLASKAAVKIDGECVQVDPQLLFQRLSLIAMNGSNEDPASFFKYELCTYPAALFDRSSLPWEANKPALADALWKLVKNENEILPDPVHYVLDGGSLLHRLSWKQGETFQSVCARYVTYVTTKYGEATIVFDGYDSGPDVKDATHQRRSHGSGPTVALTHQTVVTLKKKDFLSNKANKQNFLCILSSYLEEAGCLTAHARSDADVLIIQTAIQSSKTVNTVVVGEDTDLLILLLHHADMDGKELYFRPEPKRNAKKVRLWNIKISKEKLGSRICSKLLFIHAITGCDTTSRLYGIGKTASLSKIQCSDELNKIGEAFMQDNAKKDDIINAGENALVLLYNGDSGDDLDALRYKRFQEKVVKSFKYVDAKDLPPTSASAKFHSLRVYYQVQEWRGETGHLDPEKWGWEITNQQLMPVQTDMPPAPKDLLRIFRCNCKTGCDSRRCTCKKHGLECTPACGECKGLSCSNSPKPSNDSDDDLDD